MQLFLHFIFGQFSIVHEDYDDFYILHIKADGGYPKSTLIAAVRWPVITNQILLGGECFAKKKLTEDKKCELLLRWGARP